MTIAVEIGGCREDRHSTHVCLALEHEASISAAPEHLDGIRSLIGQGDIRDAITGEVSSHHCIGPIGAGRITSPECTISIAQEDLEARFHYRGHRIAHRNVRIQVFIEQPHRYRCKRSQIRQCDDAEAAPIDTFQNRHGGRAVVHHHDVVLTVLRKSVERVQITRHDLHRNFAHLSGAWGSEATIASAAQDDDSSGRPRQRKREVAQSVTIEVPARHCGRAVFGRYFDSRPERSVAATEHHQDAIAQVVRDREVQPVIAIQSGKR